MERNKINWDTAQVCLGGHLLNARADHYQDRNAGFCSKCGQRTVTACPTCKASIRGYSYNAETQMGLYPPHAPSYCHNCGKPYPWTEGKAQAVAEMIDELDGLAEEEKDKLRKSIPDIVAETPRSEAAVLRFKKAAVKAGQLGGKFLTEVLAKVAAEAVKKLMGL